jgi:NitT/TauT family transport system substrate-binding protein
MIDRRSLIAGAALALAHTALPRSAASAGAAALRVASVKFGSLSWLLDTIKVEGLAVSAGLDIEIVDVASNQAGPVALLADEVDVIVSDWTWALRQRAQGEALKFAPYSSALGAVMVPKDSPLKSLADLAGKRLGVAGSPIDKSWLLLRGYSRKTIGKDLNDSATIVYGQAPLLNEEFRAGRLDAILNFWTYAARLAGDGYVELIRMSDILKAMEIEPVPALVGFIWKDSTEAKKGPFLEAFFKVVGEGNAILGKSDAAWERLRPLIRPGSDQELKSITSYYRSGIPPPWGAAETASAEKLMKLLIELGDQELVGHGTRFDAQLFHAAG